jgi:glycosyltransferase involved in cell wall biosynthesis
VLAIRPSTQALRQLVANARALLMPSLAEGYGLPVVEALAMGTPVIASDIPPHAEIAQGCADLSPLGDADGWAARIEALAFDPSALAAARARAAAFRPVTRAAYFERLRGILLDL